MDFPQIRFQETEQEWERETLISGNFQYYHKIISHIFPGGFIDIPQVVQKVWRFSSSILTIFIDFSDFLTFPCCKEASDVSILQMKPAFFFDFSPTLSRLFNNSIKL